MRRPDAARRRFALLALAAFTLGVAGAPEFARAQTGAQPDVDQFGGIIASARGNAIQATYDSPNLLATGSPVLQFSIPEAVADLSSGPVGYALSSFLFPGPLIADLDAALTASGQSTGIPPYPIRAEAFYPAGPEQASDGQQGAEMVSSATYGDVRARGAYAGLSLDPAAYLGGMVATAQSVVEKDQLISRTRTEVSDFSFAGGLIAIDSIVTDLIAASDGSRAASSGRTTVSGVTVLGLPATLDSEGIKFVDPPESPDESNPIGGAVGGLTGGATDGVVDQLDPVAGPINDLFNQVGAVGDDALKQLFEQSGIEVVLADPVETVEGGLATRSSSGVSITMNYDGQNTPVFTELFGLVPVADVPSDNVGPIPFSPQALVRLFEKIHTIRFAVGIGDVSVQATPAFTFEAPVFVPPAQFVPDTPSPGQSTGSPTNSVSQPTGTEARAPQVIETVPVATDWIFAWGTALPALLVLGAILAAPMIGVGTSKLADNALSEVVASCPAGLDNPPTRGA